VSSAALSFRSILSAACLAIAIPLALADLLGGTHLFAAAALVLVIAHFAFSFDQLKTNARSMLAAVTLAAGLHLLLGGKPDSFVLAASQSIYLPTLVAVMTLLRVAAQSSPTVGTAARYVVDQPPSRRFALLAFGGHIFGILLNVGGLQLLLHIALRRRDGVPDHVAEIQARRMTNAILRGFVATMLWSPVGIAINLLIPLLSGMDWLDWLPYGFAMTMAWLVLGWTFDRLEPRPRSAQVRTVAPGSIGSLLAVLGLLISITGTAGLAEALLGMPLRAAILIAVPAATIVWVAATTPARSDLLPRLTRLGQDGFRALPASANEICIMTTGGLLGLLMAQMIPAAAVSGFFSAFGLGPGGIACLIVITMVVTGIVGISPLVTAVLFVVAAQKVDTNMPNAMLMAATMAGWCCTTMLSPVTTTVSMASTANLKSASTIGLRWNGPFAITVMTLSCAGFLAFGWLAL